MVLGILVEEKACLSRTQLDSEVISQVNQDLSIHQYNNCGTVPMVVLQSFLILLKLLSLGISSILTATAE